MYLLNPYVFNPQFMLYVHLHSTMYLLNPKAVEKEDVLLDKFTFHYVSIKSWAQLKEGQSIGDLHSTMYLLNREPSRVEEQ